MKNYILVLFLMLINFNSHGAASKIRVTVTQEEFTIGLNEATKEPLPGSDWEVRLSTSHMGDCSEHDEQGFVYDAGEKVSNISVSIAPTYNDCQPAIDLGHPQDPHNRVTWVDLGLVSSAENGQEVLECGIGKECNIYQEIVEREEIFTVLNPTSGVKGTAAGYADIFSFKIFNYTAENLPGIGGLGGVADLPNDLDNIRYCVKLRDAVTDGVSSVYAYSPELYIQKINWRPIVQGENGNNGGASIIGPKKKKTEIMQGLDHVTRKYLESILVDGVNFTSDE
jgi:hypothetical protein